MIKENRTLQDLASKEHGDIMRDLSHLSIKQGKFVISEFTSDVEEEEFKWIYVYEHSEYFRYSSVQMSRLAGFCLIEECKEYVKPCFDTRCHSHYLPYFYSNDCCKAMFGDILPEDFSSLFDDGTFDKRKARYYNEDDWTYRLYQCLRFKKIHAEYTAEYRGRQVEKSWRGRLPEAVSYKSLLFRGSPDLIITTKKERNTEGFVDVTTDNNVGGDDNVGSDNNMGNNDDVSPDVDSSPTDNQESGTCQMGHQMTNTQPFKTMSFLTEKVGELVTALHTSLACQALRRYVRRKKVSSLTAHGLHIHRTLGVDHLEVTLSDRGPMKVKATHLVDGCLTAGVLCPIMKLFLEKLSSHS